mgnify:CR=1 FL=1
MWLTYVDESGNTGAKLDDPNQPYHVLAAISVREDVVAALASQPCTGDADCAPIGATVIYEVPP